MKTLTGVIALMLALLFGASNGVIAAEQKSQPTSGERKGQPGQDPLYPGSPRLLTGKVTAVNPTAKTFTVKRKDGAVITLDASKLTTSPKVGQFVHVQYVDVGGNPPVVQSATVCSGGYWWTISWGGMTQGGPCSVEGAVK